MTELPTRWRTAIEDQMRDAEQRVERAQRYINDGNGSRALQEAYPAVVAAATIHVWHESPPWRSSVPAEEMQRRVRDALPNLFAALVEMNVQEVLTKPWEAADAEPYVNEASEFVQAARGQADQWLAQD